MLKKNEHIIKEVYAGSIAEEMEIEPGDILLEINHEPIEDVFDYRFLIKDEYLEVLIRKSNGEEWLLEIEKGYDDDLGLEFESGLMSEYRSCTNRCIFCFIDQMPPGMRETLYFKDDDSRLSFLQGNYITLTNMRDQDIDRIIRMQLAPINISVHTTNPELRCKMLNNRFAGEKLQYIKKLYDGHVEMNGQIVCCKNINDKEELRSSIQDLISYLPFMRSVSVVPAGITRYRENLFPIQMFTKDEAAAIIDMIEAFQKQCYQMYGLHFIHASDEFYIMAEREFPEEERYDGYLQLENGVGMMRLFLNEFKEAYEALKENTGLSLVQKELKRTVTIATGKLAYAVMKESADKLMQLFPGLQVHVLSIRNDFFGETITVSGLITGQDLCRQIKDYGRQTMLGDAVLIPCNMLRTGEQVFLDDVTIADLEAELKMHVIPVEADGGAFIESILNPDYRISGSNEQFVYIDAYGTKTE